MGDFSREGKSGNSPEDRKSGSPEERLPKARASCLIFALPLRSLRLCGKYLSVSSSKGLFERPRVLAVKPLRPLCLSGE